LYQSTVQTAERLAVLNQSSANIGSSLDLDEIYASIHKAAESLMPVDAMAITLLDEPAQEIEAVYLVDRGTSYPVRRAPLGQGISSRIIDSGRPLLIRTFAEAEALGTLTVEGTDQPPSVLAVPMTLVGKSVGMLSVQNYQPNAYTEEDLQILGTLANQAIIAIQNARLLSETQNLATQLEVRVVERTAQLQREQQNTETLLRILTEVSSSLDLDRALNRTLSLLNEAIGAEQGTIMLVHAEDNLLHYRAGYGYLTDRTDANSRGFTMRIGEGLAGWVVQNREAVLVNDLHADSRWVRSKSGQDHRSAIIVPMLVGEDVIGVLMVFQRAADFFSAEMLNLVKAIASQVAVAINNAHLYELIRDQAERLGVMLRKEQEEASRSQAILEAVADGVLVTGPDNRITFVNSSTERVDRLKSEFVATVSHELRTPMTAIKGYVDILVMGAAGALNENQIHFLDIVRNNIDRLNTLVSDLLDVSSMESGRITLKPQPVDLRELAEEVLQEMTRRSQTEHKPMALKLDIPSNIPPVLGDTERVRQILGNLVDNAYNYTPENGTIRVGIHQENGDIQVDVEDNGVGIAPEDQPRVFERFFRGEHPLVLATPGTGLGLPIVRQLIEMQSGRIWMQSSGVPGEGSTFSFTLPVHK
jgi:signal transduction histidine kinase